MNAGNAIRRLYEDRKISDEVAGSNRNGAVAPTLRQICWYMDPA